MTAPIRVDDAVLARAPAKLNLHLGVGPLREDKFHELLTVFCALSISDEVVASESDGLSLEVTGEGVKDVPKDKRNLAWRAAALLAKQAGIDPDVHLEIRKAIPVAAGLAGGSADAAAALIACDALWQTGADREDLVALGAQLGSDVVFSLTGGLSLGTGRGERLSPVLAAGKWHWVLAIAKSGLSTVDVYAELDRIRADQEDFELQTPTALMNALRSRDLDLLAESLSNDMEPAAISLMPSLRQTKRAGIDEGARAALLCGSGPTYAFLVQSEDNAVDVAARVAGAGVCRTVRTATGPVSGARIIG